jgi:hypothetical protein
MIGQGKSLPPDYPYQGQWLIEDLLFIHEPTDAQSFGGLAPRFAAHTPGALGFDASQIADGMGVTARDIFRANANGNLIVRHGGDAPARGGVAGSLYLFRIGERRCALVVALNDNAGSA